jgi:hypothetical protein
MAWVGLVALMIFAEVMPRPLWWTPPIYYTYQISKLLGFAMLGYLTPLTFWRFGSLGRGVAFGLLSTAGIESVQNFIEGHHFSFFEMGVKLAILMVGFGLALLTRYDKHIRVGPVWVDLVDEHWRENARHE